MADNSAKLKSLPVPELPATLDKLRTVISAVSDVPEAAITDFAANQGSRLQENLQKFAAEQDAQHSSWLAQRWLEDYLRVRTPLHTSTNVGFQLCLPSAAPAGLDRVAELIHRIARVHLLQASGDMPEEIDPRGNPIDAGQWLCFNGGLRHPAPECDTVQRCELGPQQRSIGVLCGGRMFDMPISDASGQVASVASIRAALAQIRDMGAGANFADASYAGSGDAGLQRLVRADANLPTYHTLRDQLFTVTLLDDDGDEVARRLRNATFLPGQAWIYKPLSYMLSCTDGFAMVHVEHSTVDGATLVTAVQRIQDMEVLDAGAGADVCNEWQELRWEDAAGAADGAVAGDTNLEVALVPVRRVPAGELPFKFSADAMAQLLLSVAQQLTYGTVRAVYEAVDMREYKAGRTECLRAVTPEAVAFAAALVEGTAPPEQLRELLDAALLAHRNWVIGCKTGGGIDRHLWGLAFTAEKLGETMELLQDPAVVAARTDFLSTTSIGSDRQIIRYIFAPTVPEGFGVNYTPGADAIEYCLIWNRSTTEKPAEFQQNLVRAGELLARFLRG